MWYSKSDQFASECGAIRFDVYRKMFTLFCRLASYSSTHATVANGDSIACTLSQFSFLVDFCSLYSFYDIVSVRWFVKQFPETCVDVAEFRRGLQSLVQGDLPKDMDHRAFACECLFPLFAATISCQGLLSRHLASDEELLRLICRSYECSLVFEDSQLRTLVECVCSAISIYTLCCIPRDDVLFIRFVRTVQDTILWASVSDRNGFTSVFQLHQLTAAGKASAFGVPAAAVQEISNILPDASKPAVEFALAAHDNNVERAIAYLLENPTFSPNAAGADPHTDFRLSLLKDEDALQSLFETTLFHESLKGGFSSSLHQKQKHQAPLVRILPADEPSEIVRRAMLAESQMYDDEYDDGVDSFVVPYISEPSTAADAGSDEDISDSSVHLPVSVGESASSTEAKTSHTFKRRGGSGHGSSVAVPDSDTSSAKMQSSRGRPHQRQKKHRGHGHRERHDLS
jgi:hypothetical protein